MKEIHVLVDFENVQPTMEDLAKLVPGLTDVWLFHGLNETKKAQLIAAANSRVTLVPHTGKGKNALDFHLSFYLGYVAAKHPQAQLVVVANDRGYDSMIGHAKLLGFTARRVGYKAKPAPAAKAAPAKGSATQKAPVGEVAVAPVPAKVAIKKVVAKKVVAQKAPAVKAAKPKAAVQKVAAKKVAPQKGAIKKPPTKKQAMPVKPKPATPALAAVPDLEAKTFTRIQKGLLKMGDKAPHKLMPFLRHVGALLGKGSTAEQIDAVVAKLEKAGAVRVAGDLVLYASK